MLHWFEKDLNRAAVKLSNNSHQVFDVRPFNGLQIVEGGMLVDLVCL
jgi:hypothetical protein